MTGCIIYLLGLLLRVSFDFFFFFFFFLGGGGGNCLGWKGNVEQRTGGAMATTAPVFQGSMNR